MSDTTKTVLLVAGAGVGVFVLLKVLQPSPVMANPVVPRQGSDVITLGSLVGVGKSFFDTFGTTKGTAPSVIDTPGGFYVTPTEAKNIADYNAQPGTQAGIYGLDYGPGITY